jgi:L-ascorbate metabolism protein UlaG (beta-lactamase superfamily)
MEMNEIIEYIKKNISWFGQSSVRIITKTGKVIYIDPYKKIKEDIKADFIFVTHPHQDHFNPRTIMSLGKDETRLIMPRTLKQFATDAIDPGEKKVFGDLTVTGVAAYNLRGFPHPKKNHWLGYLINIDGITIYHGGDTDCIPEMKNLMPDIAFLPVTGFVSMNKENAIEAAGLLMPKIVVPIHYGLLPGTRGNGKKFSDVYSGKTILMDKI